MNTGIYRCENDTEVNLFILSFLKRAFTDGAQIQFISSFFFLYKVSTIVCLFFTQQVK
jgi:hypothetical protein